MRELSKNPEKRNVGGWLDYRAGREEKNEMGELDLGIQLEVHW